MKIYSEKNVYYAFLERIKFIFKEFENIYISFSGGKDSSIMIQLVNLYAKTINRKFDVLYIDLEANYKSTRKHVFEIEKLSQINKFYWICLPLKLRNAVSQQQTHWVCWEETQKQNWVRTRPSNSINIKNHKFDFYKLNMQFEDFVVEFSDWYFKLNNCKKLAVGVGIRTNESLNRFRTINSDSKIKYRDKNYTTLIKKTKKEIYNFYPIYDFETKDIWIATFKFNLLYNKFYDVMYKSGYSIHEIRLCQPFGDDQKQGLNQFKFYEPETWAKLLQRVKGVNFGNIYAKTLATGHNKIHKPIHLNWEQYSIFLLETIKKHNLDLMLHYVEKIKIFISHWEKFENQKMVDEGDLKLESLKKIPSWRRIAKMLIKNDFYAKSLSFGMSKKDNEKLDIIMKK